MADYLDLDEHRKTLNTRLDAIRKDLGNVSDKNQALFEFTILLNEVLDNVEQKVGLLQAEVTLFEKLLLGGVRFSKNWEDFQEKCLDLEQKLGYLGNK